MVAAVAAKIGMKCRLVQESWVPHEDAVYDRVGNILLSRIMGAEIEMVDEGFDIGIRQSWEAAIADVKAKGGKPYAIPAGASVHKYGGLGYVGFAEEVRAQEKQLGFAFDYIIVCTVTGSTHAGMLVGFAKDGRARKVIGIDASFTPAQTKAQVLAIAQNTAKLVELGREIVEDDVVLIEDYAHPAYGVPSHETKEAIRLCARLEGMITDPVYEGKSMQGMIDLVQKGYFPGGIEDPLRPSRRRAGAQRLRLCVPQRLKSYCAFAIRRRLLITQPSAAKAAPSTSAIVAPSRPARPKHSAASAAPLVCPIRRAVATMPLALPLRPAGALDIKAFMFGAWKKPNPQPQIAMRQTISATCRVSRQHRQQRHSDAEQGRGRGCRGCRRGSGPTGVRRSAP